MSLIGTIIALGVVAALFWILRQVRRVGKLEQEIEESNRKLTDTLRKWKAGTVMEKEFDEETENILRELADDDNGSRVRSPIHRPPT